MLLSELSTKSGRMRQNTRMGETAESSPSSSIGSSPLSIVDKGLSVGLLIRTRTLAGRASERAHSTHHRAQRVWGLVVCLAVSCATEISCGQLCVPINTLWFVLPHGGTHSIWRREPRDFWCELRTYHTFVRHFLCNYILRMQLPYFSRKYIRL